MDAQVPGLSVVETECGGLLIGDFYIPHKDRHGTLRSIHHFKDFSEIKKGGFGTFYKALDKDSNKWVIMKSYDLDKDPSHDNFAMILTEINSLRRTKHGNLVPLLEVVSGETLLSVWITFDVYQFSLRDILKFSSFLVPCLEKKILQETLQGLKYLHSANYCHGNLNPENILFDSDGVLKLTDYANPYIYHETTPLDGSEIRDPILNMMLQNCVLKYKPLEILMGCKKQHPAIDMWAVGCIFAELLLKKPLFDNESVTAVCEDIINLLGCPDDKRLPKFSTVLQQNNIKIEGARRCTKLHKKFVEEATCVHLLARLPLYNPEKSYTKLEKESIVLEAPFFRLLAGLLVYNPDIRYTAEKSLMHPYFCEAPLAGTDENMAQFLKAVQDMPSPHM